MVAMTAIYSDSLRVEQMGVLMVFQMVEMMVVERGK
jgi:hypothetical protein